MNKKNEQDYSGVTVYDALFGETMLGKYSDAVDHDASMANFKAIVLHEMMARFPGINLVITCVPGIHGDAPTIVQGDKKTSSENQINEVGEIYGDICLKTISDVSWVVLKPGESFSLSDKLIMAITPIIIKEADGLFGELNKTGVDSLEEAIKEILRKRGTSDIFDRLKHRH